MTTIKFAYYIVFAITPMMYCDRGVILQMLAMVASLSCLNFKQEWSLRIMIRGIYRSDTCWN